MVIYSFLEKYLYSIKKQLLKTIFSQYAKIFLFSLVIGLILGLLISNPFSYYAYKSITITLLKGLMTVSATLFGIIIAFTTFWYSSALSSLEKVRTDLRSQLDLLDTEIKRISEYKFAPKESEQSPQKEKLQKLEKISVDFLNALKALNFRFRRATLGTYYDDSSIFKLNAAVHHLGGEWMETMSRAFRGNDKYDIWREMHEIGISVFSKTTKISSRILSLNDELKSMYLNIDTVIGFVPSLLTMVSIFIISMILTFYLSTLAVSFSVITISISVLIIWISSQLAILTYKLGKPMLIRHSVFQANRVVDLEKTNKIEKRYKIDYQTAMLEYAETMVKAMEDSPKNEGATKT